MPKARCPNCGTIVTHATGYDPICPTCGFGREAANRAPAAPPAFSAPPEAPGYGFSSPPTDQAMGPPQNGAAIGALVCGIAGFVVGITAPVAIVLGIVALNQRVDSSGRTMAIIGIVLGALVTIGYILFFMFLAAIFGDL